MSNFPLIGDAPLDGGVVVSVDGRIGIVTLDDLYAIIGHTHTNVEIIAFLGYTPEDSANKGAVNGYAGLDGTGKVPLDQLPGGIGAVTSVDTRTGDVTLDDLYEDLTDKGVANGYAGLDGTGKVPLAQLPDSLGAVFSVDARVGDVTLGDIYEPIFSKNTGFNKNFGSASGDVVEGDKGALLAGRPAGQYIVSESATVVVFSTGTVNPTLAQRNSTFEFTQTGGAATLQIQLDSTLLFPDGARFYYRKFTTDIVNITKVGGVTFRGALGDNPVVLSGQDGYSGYIEKIAANTWLLERAVQAP